MVRQLRMAHASSLRLKHAEDLVKTLTEYMDDVRSMRDAAIERVGQLKYGMEGDPGFDQDEYSSTDRRK